MPSKFAILDNSHIIEVGKGSNMYVSVTIP